MALKIGRITLGVAQTNCYFVYRDDTTDDDAEKRSVLVFDPADRGDYIFQGLTDKGFKVAGILLTHGHFDHIWGVERLTELSGAKVYALDAESELCESPSMNVSESVGRACSIRPDELLKDGQEFEIDGIKGKVLATPGHTAGSCCYYFQEDNILISGDTLFQESVGRTDLPTGSMSLLIRSIKEKLMTLPEETMVYPGHGDVTSIGHEMQYNPFL